jgi:dephospho-CoA kinase
MIIGVTGGIGAGKSTFIDYFRGSVDWLVLNMDIMCGIEMTSNQTLVEKIKEMYGDESYICVFGQRCLSLNREYLTSKVFSNKDELARFNSEIKKILVPDIVKKIGELKQIERSLIVEGALIFESGISELFDLIINICADEKLRTERVLARDNRPMDHIKTIISTQLTDLERMNLSDISISNNGDKNILEFFSILFRDKLPLIEVKPKFTRRCI